MQTINAMFYVTDDNIANKENVYAVVPEIQDEIRKSACILHSRLHLRIMNFMK